MFKGKTCYEKMRFSNRQSNKSSISETLPMNTISLLQRFLLRSLIPVVCSILVGMLFFQMNVFVRTYSSFQYIANAITASLFYNLLISVRRRDAYLGLVILLFLTFATARSNTFQLITRDIFCVAAIAATVVIYVRYYRNRLPGNMFYPGIVVGGLYGVLYIVASSLQLLILWVTNTGARDMSIRLLAPSTSFWGVTIGFAVGMGIAVAEKFIREPVSAAGLEKTESPEDPQSGP